MPAAQGADASKGAQFRWGSGRDRCVQGRSVQVGHWGTQFGPLFLAFVGVAGEAQRPPSPACPSALRCGSLREPQRSSSAIGERSRRA